MKNKKLWISLSIAGVLLLVAAVVVWFSCSGSSGWEWEDDEDDDDDSSVSSDDDDDGMQSAIDQMIATVGLESVIVEVGEFGEGDYQVLVKAQVPCYTELFLASYAEKNPDIALQSAIMKKEYSTVSYEGYAPVRTVDGQLIADTDTLVRGFIEQELIKAINAVMEAEEVDE